MPLLSPQFLPTLPPFLSLSPGSPPLRRPLLIANRGGSLRAPRYAADAAAPAGSWFVVLYTCFINYSFQTTQVYGTCVGYYSLWFSTPLLHGDAPANFVKRPGGANFGRQFLFDRLHCSFQNSSSACIQFNIQWKSFSFYGERTDHLDTAATHVPPQWTPLLPYTVNLVTVTEQNSILITAQ